MSVYGIIRGTLLFLTGIVFITTALPLSGSHSWWVRAWDFPRAQIAVVAFIALIAVVIFSSGTGRIVMATCLLVCLAYQCFRIFPYTPFAKTELTLAKEDECDEIITLFSANVLMENDEYDDLRREIAKVDPDVLLLMETDEKWTKEMESVLSEYETVVRVPKDNHYGMIFASRLRARKAVAVYLVNDETPAVFAELEDAKGRVLRYVGLHPRPPLPGADTEERDAQILFAARFARQSHVPLVAMGDFNDAAWSDTADLFKSVGEYLDPRVGRGFYASFDARSKLLRAPIDHFYHSEEVAVVSFHRGAYFGSDHFPIVARVCLDRDLAKRLNNTPEPIEDSMRERSEDIIAARSASLGDALDN